MKYFRTLARLTHFGLYWLLASALLGCSTVDFSQAIHETPSMQFETQTQTQVQAAANVLRQKVQTKGWAIKSEQRSRAFKSFFGVKVKAAEALETNLAISHKSEIETIDLKADIIATAQLLVVLNQATTFALANDRQLIVMDKNLSALEQGLLYGRAALAHFQDSTGTRSPDELFILQAHVETLRLNTNVYGEKVRQQISILASQKAS